MTESLRIGHDCPACGSQMRLSALTCDCGVKVEGPVEVNEFARLSSEQLHFLRIFVMFEGKIRDIESALGISYPTVKARISDLKEALRLHGETIGEETVADEGNAEVVEEDNDDLVTSLLDGLEAGEVSVQEALVQLGRKRS